MISFLCMELHQIYERGDLAQSKCNDGYLFIRYIQIFNLNDLSQAIALHKKGES